MHGVPIIDYRNPPMRLTLTNDSDEGMFAEYEKAQLMERYRRGKACRARAGSVNVLSMLGSSFV